MEIEINGKIYRINSDVKFGIMELLDENPEDVKVIKMIIKDILIPTPSNEDMFDFRKSDIERIFIAFSNQQEEENKTFKKKLSR